MAARTQKWAETGHKGLIHPAYNERSAETGKIFGSFTAGTVAQFAPVTLAKLPGPLCEIPWKR